MEENIKNSYGFSLVSNEELKKTENELNNLLKQLDGEHNTTLSALDSVLKIVVPLLEELTKDPEKEYIYWTDRSTKVTEILTQINGLVKSD